MLRLMLGRAKSGKTGAMMAEIAELVERGTAGIVLLVPEQYSHEAETELLRVCGDRLSLYAEVLSFTRLWARVEAETGGKGAPELDRGGRTLCLARALDAVGSRLKVFGGARRQTALQQSLLTAIDECKTGLVAPDALLSLAGNAALGEALGEKLADLALVYEAFEAVAGRSGLDPFDRLTRLSERVDASGYARCRFYLDGFTDFTAQENAVIAALLRAGAEVAVCLTCPGLDEDHEIFEPSRRAAARLKALAEETGVSCEVTVRKKQPSDAPMDFAERELFSFGPASCDAGGAVSIVRAGGVPEECEAAAARCLALARQTGCRWREIAVAARDFELYRPGLESAFARYGVPLYAARRSDLLSRPLPSLIAGAYAVVTRGWEYEDVTAYLKTGLAGLDPAEIDAVENYAFLWSLKGNAWAKDEDWALHPDGFAKDFDEDSSARLAALNVLRRRAMAPLWALAERGRAAGDAAGQARALAGFFEALELPRLLERRSGELQALGMAQEAGEYAQLWEITAGALEQCCHVLGDAEMDTETFGKLYCLVLSSYDVGTIPLSLDRVSAGDMTRMRRRRIRHLLVLGCDSDTLPLASPAAGIFTDQDRESLRGAGMELGDTAERRLSREFSLIYNCLTLPSDTLCLSWAAEGGENGAAQPAFVVARAEKIFGIEPEPVNLAACRLNAPGPAFSLAAGALREFHGPENDAARRYFEQQGGGAALSRLDAAAKLTRGRLSPSAVRALYGDTLRLSASRADRLAACRFGHFMQYGLNARPRQAAEFAPPEMGTFMHYVLENVAREVRDGGGFRKAGKEQIDALCDRYVERYIHEKLWDFKQKSKRFIYLFRRLIESVRAVVADMAEELRRGDFEPLDFELNFGDPDQFDAIRLGSGKSAVTLTGVADRVDGWLYGDKLYLRVMDYKTGRKSFSLSDVWYGMGLQMLLYLFALGREGEERYGREIVPAGVLYIPARDVLVSARAELSPEEIAAEKAKQLRRSGLLLEDPAVLDAMERGEEKVFLPIRYNKNREAVGEALASAERFGLLSRHVDETLQDLARGLRDGSIAADPWFRSQTENACTFCDYAEACQFSEDSDRVRFMPRLRAAEVWAKLEGEGEEDDGL